MDPVVDPLYAGPLERFTQARNELAEQLREDGHEEAADEVRRLRKPTVVAWAVNQLVHRHRAEIEALLELRDRLGEETRTATSERRKMLNALTRRAEAILAESDHRVASDTVRRISTTLLAASTGAEEQAFRLGRLTRELEPTGFDSVFGSPAFDEAESQAADDDDRARRDRARRLSEEASAAERAAVRLQRDASVARQEAESAARAAAEAERRAEKAANVAEDARRAADEALDEQG